MELSKNTYGAAWLLGLIAMFLFIQSASALRCWECSSELTPNCADPMVTTDHHSTFHNKDCDQMLSQHPYSYQKPICRKAVKRVNGQRVVVRSCSLPYPEEVDITEGPCHPDATASHSTVESCSICSTDLCNSATSISTSHMVGAVVVALVVRHLSSGKLSIL